MKYFLWLWAVSALAALVALFVVLVLWLLVHLGLDDETTSLMLRYITNFRLVLVAAGASALIGLIEATVIRAWQSQKSQRT
jgi:hypothetical protein